MAAGLAAGLIAVGGLVGCSEDGDDEPADSGLPSKAEVSESPSASPGTETTPAAATQPELPDEATRPGRAGARAFVAYYVALENYASETGDVDPLIEYSHPECGGCQDLIRFYGRWYERGGWFKGAHRTILSFDRVFRAVSPHDMYIRLHGRTSGGTYRERRGAPIHRARGDRFDLLLWLIREQQGWQVSRLDTP
jgi:uncharacterized protein DUF6318